MDRVDRIRQEWQQAIPDLDTSSLEVTGRVLGLAARIEATAEAALADSDVGIGDFAVLVTLRRVGKTGGLSAGDITAATMVTAGATTQRLDRLEKLQLVERRADPDDRRALRVHLTRKGTRTADRVMRAVTDAERTLISPLTTRQQATLADLLRTLNTSHERS